MGPAANRGVFFATLAPWDERKAQDVYGVWPVTQG